ncbi:MAG: hypothetical protein GY943_19880 [Chloroflexi bacterium]|nr:hypothetical protein [Chloroflexota bacterium]
MTTLNVTTPDYELGLMRSKHRITNSRAGGQYVGGLLLMGLGGVCMAIAGMNLNANPTLATICGLLGLFLLGAGILTLRNQKREQALALYAFQDGLVYVHNGRIDTLRWDEVNEVYLTTLYNRNARRTHYDYKLCGIDGSVVKFNYYDHVVNGMKQLSDTIQQEVTERQLPKTAVAYYAGQSIPFGSLSVSKEGISKGSKMLLWAEVEDVQMDRGYISIRKRNKRTNWADIPVGKIPNVMTLMTLVNQVRSQS